MARPAPSSAHRAALALLAFSVVTSLAAGACGRGEDRPGQITSETDANRDDAEGGAGGG